MKNFQLLLIPILTFFLLASLFSQSVIAGSADIWILCDSTTACYYCQGYYCVDGGGSWYWSSTNKAWASDSTCYWCGTQGTCTSGDLQSDPNKPSDYYVSDTTCYYGCTVSCEVGGWTRSGCSSCSLADHCSDSATHSATEGTTGDYRHYNGQCTSTGCSFLSENCNDYDGWYDTGNTQWITDPTNECKEIEQKEQEYRDYTCSNGACVYTVTNTQWVDTGNTRNKASCTTCTESPYCSGTDRCGGTEGDTRYYNFHCDGLGNCVAQSSTNCRCDASETDTGKDYLTQGTCTDYTGCSGGYCQSSSYTDYCVDSTTLREYYVSGSGDAAYCGYEDKNCADLGSGYTCSGGACVAPECVPAQEIICHSTYPGGTYDSACSQYYWNHSTCGSTQVCKEYVCRLVDADLTSYTLPSGTYARSDKISIPYTLSNVGQITWTFLDETEITKSDNSKAWVSNWDTLSAGNTLSNSLNYTIECTDPLGTWSGLLYTYTDQAVHGGWEVWGMPSYSFEVVECLDDSDCVSCLGSGSACNLTTNTCSALVSAVSGTVKDTEDEPIPGATVNATGPSYGEDITDSNGNYLISNLDPGDYTVTASAIGYQSKSLTITLTGGETARVDFTGPNALTCICNNNDICDPGEIQCCADCETRVTLSPTFTYPGDEVTITIEFYDSRYYQNHDVLINLTIDGNHWPEAYCKISVKKWSEYWDLSGGGCKKCGGEDIDIISQEGYGKIVAKCIIPPDTPAGTHTLKAVPTIYSIPITLKAVEIKIIVGSTLHSSLFNFDRIIENFLLRFTGFFILK
jgi:hypothetical protein